LAGRKVYAKPVEIPTVPGHAIANTQGQSATQAAIDDTSNRVIYADGMVDVLTINAAASTDDLRYLVFREGAAPSAINFPFARNWRVTVEAPGLWIPWFVGGSYWTRVRFTNSTNCLLERIHYKGQHKGAVSGGGTLGLWDNSGGGESRDCGFQWVVHENTDTSSIATADFVLFGCLGDARGRGLPHVFRSRNGFIYNCRSRNPGDFFQITSEKPEAGWNTGTTHPGFHLAGIDCWADTYNDAGLSIAHENLIDIKGGSDEDASPIILEDFRYFGARRGIHWPNSGAKVVNDPGTAGVIHMEKPHNVTFQRGVVWDCSIGWSVQPGYDANRPTRNDKLNDNLFYDIGNVPGQDGYGIYFKDDGVGGHEINRNGLIRTNGAFRVSDAAGCEIAENVIAQSTGSGWTGNANSHGNLSDRNYAGASTAGYAAREARMTDLQIEMPDPANMLSNTGVMVTLSKALVHPDDAPADYIWVTGNEEGAGTPPPSSNYIPVTEVTGTSGSGASALGSTTDGYTDDSEAHRWSAATVNGANPKIRWNFGGAYHVLSAQIWWSWGAARQSKYTLEAIDANGAATPVVVQALSDQRSGWQTVDVDSANIVAMELTGFGTEIDGSYHNEWTSINEVRFAAEDVDTGGNTMIELQDRQIVLDPDSGVHTFELPGTDDDGDTISYSLHDHPVYGGWDYAIGAISVAGNVITITPGQISGLAGVRVQANDGRGLSNSIAVGDWEIVITDENRPPVWNISPDTISIGQVVYIDLNNLVTDYDGDTIVYSAVTTTANFSAALRTDGHTLRVECLGGESGSVWVSASDGVHAPVQGRFDFSVIDGGAVTLTELVVEGLARA
jgi:hypothetical protein